MFRLSIIFFVIFLTYLFIFEFEADFAPLNAEVKKANQTDLSDDSAMFSKLLQDEKIIKQDDYVYILNFWASWCSPCMKELPALNRLGHIYKEKNVKIFTINADYENQELIIKKTRKSLGLTLNIIRDNNGKYVGGFDIQGLPVTIILKGAEVIEKINGEINFDDPDFRKKIDQLLEPRSKS